MSNSKVEWEDASASSYTAESTVINGLAVVVCLDDEGPHSPSFYWDITHPEDGRVDSGWGNTVARARRDAVKSARRLTNRIEVRNQRCAQLGITWVWLREDLSVDEAEAWLGVAVKGGDA